MKRGVNGFLVIIMVFLISPIYVSAAGGGGGGSSAGLGFSGARDSIFILVSQDYTAKFSLKNNTRYTLDVNVEDGNATLSFGSYYFELKKGDNFVDLNNNGLADINFKLESVKGSRANIRIINAKEQVTLKIKEPENKKVLILDVIAEDQICVTDDNCTIIMSTCEQCECGVPINKEHKQKYLNQYELLCSDFGGPMCGYECPTPLTKCIKNRCILAAQKEIKKQDKDEGLKCGNLKTIKERVSCRIDQEEYEQEEELELYYLPEECRALSGHERGICIARYKSVQTCWKFPIGDERVSCAKRATKLETIQEEKETCNKLTGQEKSTCVKEIKNKVYNIIKWRFYDLEERAEDFMHRGLVDEESVSNLIVNLEQKKIEFNEATTKEERKNIILDVRDDWKEFVEIVKRNLRG